MCVVLLAPCVDAAARQRADVRVHAVADPTTRIAFASCKDGQGGSAEYAGRGVDFDWHRIIERRPHAFVWAGDAIYGDTFRAPRRLPRALRYFLPDVPLGKATFKPSTPAHLRRLYDELKAEEGYTALRRNVSLVTGTWDDHDYGVNDGDKRYPYRAQSKSEFLDFLDAPRNDARRRRGSSVGVYGSALIDGASATPLPQWKFDAGADHNRKVMIIALDMRYAKDPCAPRPRTRACPCPRDALTRPGHAASQPLS